MDLHLAVNVVYAILAAIVAIVLIVNVTKIVRLRMTSKTPPDFKPVPYDQETKQTWPNVAK